MKSLVQGGDNMILDNIISMMAKLPLFEVNITNINIYNNTLTPSATTKTT